MTVLSFKKLSCVLGIEMNLFLSHECLAKFFSYETYLIPSKLNLLRRSIFLEYLPKVLRKVSYSILRALWSAKAVSSSILSASLQEFLYFQWKICFLCGEMLFQDHQWEIAEIWDSYFQLICVFSALWTTYNN